MFRFFAVLLLAVVATVSAAPKPSLLAYSTPLVATAPAGAFYTRTNAHYAHYAAPYVATPYVASPYFAAAASPYVAAASYGTAYTAPYFLRK